MLPADFACPFRRADRRWTGTGSPGSSPTRCRGGVERGRSPGMTSPTNPPAAGIRIMPLRRRRDVRKLQGNHSSIDSAKRRPTCTACSGKGKCSVRKMDATCSSVAGRSNVAIAIELPNTSWIQRTDAAGRRIREVSSQPKVMAVTRPHHHPMHAEVHGIGVAGSVV